MKPLKIFGAMIILHVAFWTGSHMVLQNNKSVILLVVDTSYSMKQNFPAVQTWIENYQSTDRYKSVLIGTDKALLGELSGLKSMDVIFRTSFGKLNPDNLTRLYSLTKSNERYLLSDGSLSPEGWQLVTF